ncbi:MAG: hypothetical protein ACTS3F_06875 [Phycisphaerales bacterium]
MPLRIVLVGADKQVDYLLLSAGKKKFGMHLAKPPEERRRPERASQ